jgi:hypothetical protein
MRAKVAVVVGESMEKALVEGVGALQATSLVLGTSSRAAAKPWYVFFSLMRRIPALEQFLFLGTYCSRGSMVAHSRWFLFFYPGCRRRQTAASYCSRHAPSGCSVLVVKNKKVVFHKEAGGAKSSSIGCVSMVPTCEGMSIHSSLPGLDDRMTKVGFERKDLPFV